MGIGKMAKTGAGAQMTENGSRLPGEGSLFDALNEWRRAMELFDAADEPLMTELASIRLEAAHKRFGCIAAEYKSTGVAGGGF